MLELRELTKRYGEKKALNHICAVFEDGVYGLLGPNGAGKSTLMNIITGNVVADEGEILWKEENVVKAGEKYRAVLGYVPQQQGIYESFTGKRFLGYMATLKKIPKSQIKEEIERVAELVNLTSLLNRKLGAYSGGMKQRILIAQALMGNPKLIIMDEPTAGLDPKERVRIREKIGELSKEKIIIIATHVVSDVQSISKEIVILKEGQMLEKESPYTLIEKYAPGRTLEDVYMKIFSDEVGGSV